MSYWRDKTLSAAKAIAFHGPSNAELILARRMAHEGATIREVHEALGWPVTITTTRNRLRKFNINPLNPENRAHRGYRTEIPEGEVGARSYRPANVIDLPESGTERLRFALQASLRQIERSGQ